MVCDGLAGVLGKGGGVLGQKGFGAETEKKKPDGATDFVGNRAAEGRGKKSGAQIGKVVRGDAGLGGGADLRLGMEEDRASLVF